VSPRQTARGAGKGTVKGAQARPQERPPQGEIGERLYRLRRAHGESLREAAQRTGVSHTTITRIERGEITASCHITLEKIARGYGVPVEYLLTGRTSRRDPKQEFVDSLRALPPERRRQFYFLFPRERVRLVWGFLCNEYPGEVSADLLAHQVGVGVQELNALLYGSEPRREDARRDDEIYLRIATAISALTGISRHWFYWGGDEEEAVGLEPEHLAEYTRLIRKAARHRVPVRLLEMAIDLLIQSESQAQADPAPARRARN